MRRALPLLLLPWLLLGCVEPAADPDLDDDGFVGDADVRIVSDCINQDVAANPACALADVNGDGIVDGNDLFALGHDYGKRVCNESSDLCGRRYDQVSYPTAHNAFSTYADFGILFNQWDGLTAQLSHGVRGFMLDAWTYDADGDGAIGPDEIFLCHADCAYARRPLVDGLVELRVFLDSHPADVLTIIFESYVTPAQIAAAFDASGLTPYALDHTPGTPWPTLGAMIDAGKRLVVLTDDGSAGAPAWYVYVWDVASETPFSVRQAANFDCRNNRGTITNELFILNHFLTRNTSVPQEAATTNADPFLVDRATRCWQERGRLPNFPTVDFATTGDVVEAARLLNRRFGETHGLPPAP